jgi:hypothetical protein
MAFFHVDERVVIHKAGWRRQNRHVTENVLFVAPHLQPSSSLGPMSNNDNQKITSSYRSWSHFEQDAFAAIRRISVIFQVKFLVFALASFLPARQELMSKEQQQQQQHNGVCSLHT